MNLHRGIPLLHTFTYTVKKTLQITLLSAALGTAIATAEPLTFHSPIVDAADQGDEVTLLRFIRQGYPADSRGDFEVTPLMRAAYRGNARLVRILLSQGAYADAHDISGTTALHIAAREGHRDVILALIENDADVNVADEEGWTPLMRAALANKPHIMQLLIEKGADPSRLNELDESVLVHAVESGNVEAVEVLMDSGAMKIEPPQIQSALSISLRRGSEKISSLLNKWEDREKALSLPADDSEEQPKKETAPQSDNNSRTNIPAIQKSDVYQEAEASPTAAVDVTDIAPVTSDSEQKKPQDNALRVAEKPAFLAFEEVNTTLSEDEFKQLAAPEITPVSKESDEPDSASQKDKRKEEQEDTSSDASPSEQDNGQEEVAAILGHPAGNAPIPLMGEQLDKNGLAAASEEKPAPQKATSAPTIHHRPPAQPQSDIAEEDFQQVYTLQLGAYPNQAAAQAAWEELKKQHPDLLGNEAHNITDDTLNSAQNTLTIYQVSGGRFNNKADAQRLCNMLWRREVDCFVKQTFISSTLPEIPQKETPIPSKTVAKATTPPETASPTPVIIPATVKKVDVTALPTPTPKPMIEPKPEEKEIAGDVLPWLSAKRTAELEAAAIVQAHQAKLNHNAVAQKSEEEPAQEKKMPPPRQAKKVKAHVDIAEAIRIPPSGKITIDHSKRRRPKLQSASLPDFPVKQTPLFQRKTLPTALYWIQIGNFPTQETAINFAKMIKRNMSDSALRLRVVKLKEEAKRNEPAIALQLGKFQSLAKAKSLCLEELSYMRCKVIKDFKHQN